MVSHQKPRGKKPLFLLRLFVAATRDEGRAEGGESTHSEDSEDEGVAIADPQSGEESYPATGDGDEPPACNAHIIASILVSLLPPERDFSGEIFPAKRRAGARSSAVRQLRTLFCDQKRLGCRTRAGLGLRECDRVARTERGRRHRRRCGHGLRRRTGDTRRGTAPSTVGRGAPPGAPAGAAARPTGAAVHGRRGVLRANRAASAACPGRGGDRREAARQRRRWRGLPVPKLKSTVSDHLRERRV